VQLIVTPLDGTSFAEQVLPCARRLAPARRRHQTMSVTATRIQPRAAKARKNALKTVTIAGDILAALAGLGWLGLQVQPAPFPAVPQPPAPLKTIPLPTGLPAPVARFYRQVYGERMPLIRSAVISGRGTMRPVSGITFPARFRFTHEAGRNYRHYFETTVFGVPVMQVNEYFVGGTGRMELPWGVEAGQQIDQGANLSLWAETISMLPAAVLADARVRWEPIDDATARFVVPFGAAEERLVAHFDPATGRLRLLESMRYKGAAGVKTLWLNELQGWATLGGYTFPTSSSVTWGDDGKPWLVFTIEDVAYNVDVNMSLAAKGP
jgi:Family of unknown function (DUF6544)